MAQAYHQKRKPKAKDALIMVQAPEQFHKDCQLLMIDFEKLRSKVKWIFDKWTKKINPITGEPYPQLMVSKWIRVKMKEGGYSLDTITRTIRNIAPHLLGKQGPKGPKKSAKSGISNVTAAEQQELNGMPELSSRKSLKHDLANYDFEKRGQIIMYLWDLVEKQKLEIETLRAQLSKLQRHRSKYLTYKEASDYTRQHRIDSRGAWREHTQSKDFAHNIPVHPERHYTEWVSWKAFFGLDKATLREKQRKGAEITSKVFNQFIEINRDSTKPEQDEDEDEDEDEEQEEKQ